MGRHDPVRQKAIKDIRGRVGDFSDDYHIQDKPITHDPGEEDFDKAKEFYREREDECKQITQKKKSGLSSRRKQEIDEKRIDGILPDKNDIWLVASARHVTEKHENAVGIWSMDMDFTEFDDDLREEFDVEIFEDSLPR